MKIKKYILPVVSVLAMASCNYEDVNTNIYGITDDEMKQGGLMYGAPFMDMQKLVIPIGSPTESTGPGNDLAVTDLMSAGNYIGFWGMNNNWNFNTESSWNFTEGRMSYAYQNLYSKFFRSWNSIYKHVKDSDKLFDKEVKALTDIVKVLAWTRATDVFGPIVYTNAGNGDIAPKLDSQETVYKAMLADLYAASQVLNQSVSKILPTYDVIYNGEPQNWTRLANSLMLRLAVRVHFKDQALAKDYIKKALDPKNGGVIENMAQEAKIKNSEKMPLMNSMIPTVVDYKETRQGATIWSYLKGYGDPRMGVYFEKGTYKGVTDFYALAPTNKQKKYEGPNSPEFASKPKIDANTPLYWLRASEVAFLRAEAALFGLSEGDNAKALYEEGVIKSFEENGVNGATNYLSKDKLKPSDITKREMVYDWGYSCIISENNVSPKWDERGGQEKQLQQIITQKYLALYPNAVEAWTEYRRTGYPFLMKPHDDRAYSRIGAEADVKTPERFRFSSIEYGTNPNMNEVQGLLGGVDQGATKLWWVRSDRPKQR